jgi:hypothetical protein
VACAGGASPGAAVAGTRATRWDAATTTEHARTREIWGRISPIGGACLAAMGEREMGVGRQGEFNPPRKNFLFFFQLNSNYLG